MISLNCTIKAIKADLVTNQVTITFEGISLDTDYLLAHPELQEWGKGETPLEMMLTRRYPKQLPLPHIEVRSFSMPGGAAPATGEAVAEPPAAADAQAASEPADGVGTEAPSGEPGPWDLVTVRGLCPDCREVSAATVTRDIVAGLPMPDPDGLYPADMVFLCDHCAGKCKPADEVPPAADKPAPDDAEAAA